MQKRYGFSLIFLFFFLFVGTFSVDAKLKVASLHPLITDVARQVGGEHAEIIQLIDPTVDPHHFNPTPQTLLKAKGASLYLASGKNMETYLPKLKSTLGNSVKVVEVGRTIPSQILSDSHNSSSCCPEHTHGAIDPHWWHRVSHMQKASRVIAQEFAKADPAHAADYKANAAAYSKKLSILDSWIRREVSQIPRSHRILTTAHAAFGYFCTEYGFKALPVKGLTAHQKTSAAYQAQAIQAIRKNNVRAIFPEKRSNPKSLQVIAQETGVKMGGTLVADGASDYEKMMRNNVTKMVKALKK